MKILYFSFAEIDVPNACQTHTLGVLRGFSENGCQVDALIPRPKKVRPKISNVQFYYLWPWQFSALGKFWIKTLAGILSFFLCLVKQYDAIYVRELEINPFPRLCSILFRIPLYIEINSVLIENLKMTGADKDRILKAERHQRADFKYAKGLIVPSVPRCRWLENYYGLDSNKVHFIMNGENENVLEKSERGKALKKLLLPEKGFYLGYLGTIWECYDLIGMLESMKMCQNEIPDLYLIMIGDGPEVENLKEKSREFGLDSHVIFLGYISHDLLHEVLGAIDVGLMTMTWKGLEFGGPVTSRFATYATYKLPVIANDYNMEHYPFELRSGLSLVPPEDPKKLADKIIWLYNHSEEREKKAEITHDFVERELTWKSVTKEIINIINEDRL